MPARHGTGPLWQRDYWALIRNPTLSPRQIIELLRHHFERFSPSELAHFQRLTPRPLQLGDELDIRIAAAGRCRVRVVHLAPQGFTLATLFGHPEAGRITFGSYLSRQGGTVFHIRSRARASSRSRYLGFLGIGEAMQTNTWTTFVNRVAVRAGQGVAGVIFATTRRCVDEPDEQALSQPTYRACEGSP